MEIVSELTNNTLVPGKVNKLTLNFKKGPDINADILSQTISGLRINFTNFGNSLEKGIASTVQGRNYEMKNNVLEIRCGGTIESICNMNFDIKKVQIKSGAQLAGSVQLSFEFIPDTETPPLITNANVLIQNKKPEILSFRILPSIVTGNNKLKIALNCKNVDDVTVKDSLGTVILDKSKITFTNEACNVNILNQRTPTFDDAKVLYNLTPVDGRISLSYSLTARLNASQVSETVEKTILLINVHEWNNVVPLEKEGITDPEADYVGNRVQRSFAAIIQNSYDDKIWAIVEDKFNGGTYHLWFSEDGLDWLPYLVGEKRVNIPASYIHVPALFLNDKLCFVGGSMTDPAQCSANVLVLDLANGSSRELVNSSSMTPRSLHAAVIFPYTDRNTSMDHIWVIGGSDKKGNALNDVWRFNGNEWFSVNLGSSLPKRCMHSAAVLRKEGKPKSIWISGGFDAFEGDCYYDFWTYSPDKGEKWEPAWNKQGTDMKFAEGMNIYSTALTCINPANAVPYLSFLFSYEENDTAIVKFERDNIQFNGTRETGGVIRELYSQVRKNENAVFDPQDYDGLYKIISVEFNSCIWVMALQRVHQEKTQVSQLYYGAIS